MVSWRGGGFAVPDEGEALMNCPQVPYKAGAYGMTMNGPMAINAAPGSPFQYPVSSVINGGSGFTTFDINNASNSYMDPSGVTPVFANPSLSSVSEDLCNAIKCGAQSADDLTKYACTQSFGAGVWDRCGDPRCAPYRGTSCGYTAPTPAASIATAVAPPSFTTLTAPVPDITAPPTAQEAQTTQMGPDMLCSFSQWVNNNSLLAGALVVGLFLMVKR